MPPRRTSVVLRHRSHIHAAACDDPVAAILEWRAKAQQDEEKLREISLKINEQKKSAEATKRAGRWLAEHNSLQREAILCGLEFEKTWGSCASLLPESSKRELRDQEDRYMEILNSLRVSVMGVRGEVLTLYQKNNETLPKANITERKEKLYLLREKIMDSKKLIKHIIQELVHEEEEICEELDNDDNMVSKRGTSTESLQKLIKSTMNTFTKLYESKGESFHSNLIEIYKKALQTEGESAISQSVSGIECKKYNIELSQSDAQTVSLILRTYDSALNTDDSTFIIPKDVYDRVQQILPHTSKQMVKIYVAEVLRQKRERLRLRSIILQYKKKSTDLLDSFSRALSAEEDMLRVQECIEKETKLREERKQKTHEELEKLRLFREKKEAARREEEEAKKIKQDKKNQQILRIREAEFQERLQKLRLYQEQQVQIREKEKIILQAIEEEEEMKKAIQREHDAKRVKERQKEYEEKCRLRKIHQQEIEELKIAREKTLESFFKGVEKRLGVTCDPQRVLQGTVSSQQSETFTSFSEAAKYVVHGYTMDDFLRDPRFRLQLALLDAGLHQTSYGREVISKGFKVPAAQRPSDENPFRMEY